MIQSEIAGLAFVVFWVLVIVFIVFASKNKKLKNLAIEKTYERKLVKKHYTYYFWFSPLLPFPIIMGNQLVIDAFGKTGALYFLSLLFLLIPVMWKLEKALTEKAKQREAEGDEGYNANYKFIRKHCPQGYWIWSGFLVVVAVLLGPYISKLGFYYFFTFVPLYLIGIVPLDYWIHRKLFEKAKQREAEAR
jgi:hypothetical protein